MAEKHSKHDLVKQWIEKARHDLGIAETLVLYHSPYTDGICFHAQQAVEKLLKAMLVFFDIPFKKNHNLVYFGDLLSEKVTITDNLYEQFEILEEYAVEIRYPDAGIEPTDDQAKEALSLAVGISKITQQWLTEHGLS